MTHDEEVLSQKALEWVKRNSKVLIKSYASAADFEVVPAPVTLFMAGSPGAGKTEVSKRLLAKFDSRPVRIDADEIRALCPGYDGGNAHIFQRAANKGVNILYDHSLRVGYNVILDGTFAYGAAPDNVIRSLDKKRKVEIFFVFQDPKIAWEFTKKREALEGRRVTKEVFISSYFKAQENVKAIKEKFGTSVELNVLVKDLSGEIGNPMLDVDDIDESILKAYTKKDLEAML